MHTNQMYTHSSYSTVMYILSDIVQCSFEKIKNLYFSIDTVLTVLTLRRRIFSANAILYTQGIALFIIYPY